MKVTVSQIRENNPWSALRGSWIAWRIGESLVSLTLLKMASMVSRVTLSARPTSTSDVFAVT